MTIMVDVTTFVLNLRAVSNASAMMGTIYSLMGDLASVSIVQLTY